MDSRQKSGRLEGEVVAPLEIPTKVVKKFQKEASSVTEWQMAERVTDFVGEGKELLGDWRDIRQRRWGEEVCDRDINGGGMDEVDTDVIACDVNVAVGVGFEMGDKRREEIEGLGKHVFEVRDESVRVRGK